MKNSMILLSFVYGLLIIFTFSIASAIEYRYVSPARSAVEIDMSVLGEMEHGQDMPLSNVPNPRAVPLPVVTTIPLDIDTKAEPITLPQMRAPMPEKRLLKPFFTAHSKPKKVALPVKNLERTTSAAKTYKEPKKAKIITPSAFRKLTIEFDASSSEISSTAYRKLNALVSQMNAALEMRVQIRAYAGEDNNGQSGARRMSLSRGLMVRTYLTDKGIEPTRLDIRALGSKTEKIPLDRVDIVFVR
ncbi:MAG: OmpA family protein [Alphaproteobacteria bacterium]|nr:OmpA family protein [Alphaproteobacteria bacterium]